LAGCHVLRDRLLPRPDDRHRPTASLLQPPYRPTPLPRLQL